MDFLLKLGATLESFATAVALVVAGIWTYIAFIRERIRFPRLATQIICIPVSIPEGWILHVDVRIDNLGTVLAKVGSAELRLRQMVPLPEDVDESVQGGYDPVAIGETEIPWICLAQRWWDCKSRGLEIEPNETDSLHADFFVPAEVSVVEFYLYLANEKKHKKGIWWTQTIVKELPKNRRDKNDRAQGKVDHSNAGETAEATETSTTDSTQERKEDRS